MSDDDLLSHTRCAISSARLRFTVLFGMGRGGSTALWSSDVKRRDRGGAGDAGVGRIPVAVSGEVKGLGLGCTRAGHKVIGSSRTGN